jgi:type IV pilus assembly protein PilN
MKRLRIAMIVLAVFSLAALGVLHLVHSKAEAARAREHSLDGAIAKINAERQGYEAMMAQPKNAQFMTEVDELNDLFDDKAFSWTMAMESLETELPGGVQVTQIEPQRSKTGQITLRLRVVGPHNLADDLVKNLEHSRRFQSPRIVGEEAESANNPNSKTIEPVSVSNRYNFDLQAEYVPPTEAELATDRKKQKALEARSNVEESAPQPAPMTPNRVPPSRRTPGRVPGRGAFPGAGAPMSASPDQQGQRSPYTGGPQ